MASGLRLPLGRAAAEVRLAERAPAQAPAGPRRDLGASRLAQSTRTPPSLDVCHRLHLEPAIQAVDRSAVARRQRGGAQRTWRADGLVAALRTDSAHARGNRDFRPR